jgi:2-methylcitrate dehydratase PrpD
VSEDPSKHGRGEAARDDAGSLSRRRMLQAAGGSMAVALLSSQIPTAARSQEPRSAARRAPDLTGRLARYMIGAREAALPESAVLATKHRLADTLGAIVSGSRLKPGQAAIGYVRGRGGVAEACVAATDIVTAAVDAAFANAMFGHADETDDFHPFTKAHPGCAVVPAALAMGERQGCSGTELLRAIALGYDLGCRFLVALGPARVRASHRSAEGYSSTFGAAAAAASMARFDETQMRYAISYAAQQVSGVWSWVRDSEHIEKAFDFAGMGARNGVAAATMIQAGFSGVADALDGEHNVLDALSSEPRPEEMVADLGSRFYVEETAIKTFPVGYPIQSPLAGLFSLRREHDIAADDVEHVLVRLPADGARIVDDRAMPDVNCQHIIALALVDGAITFENSHSFERMKDPQVLAMRRRIELIADPDLVVPEAPRSGFVELTLRGGRKVSTFVKYAPGTPENPLDTEGVNAKARGLMAPILGDRRTEALLERVAALETLDDVRGLRPLLTV